MMTIFALILPSLVGALLAAIFSRLPIPTLLLFLLSLIISALLSVPIFTRFFSLAEAGPFITVAYMVGLMLAGAAIIYTIRWRRERL